MLSTLHLWSAQFLVIWGHFTQKFTLFQLSHASKLEDRIVTNDSSFVILFLPHIQSVVSFAYIKFLFIMAYYITYIDSHLISPLSSWKKQPMTMTVQSWHHCFYSEGLSVCRICILYALILQIKCLSQPLPTDVNS